MVVMKWALNLILVDKLGLELVRVSSKVAKPFFLVGGGVRGKDC